MCSPSEVAILATKDDSKLKTSLNAKEQLEEEFRQKCQSPILFIDGRNRIQAKVLFRDLLEPIVKRMHPDIDFPKRDTGKGLEEEKSLPDEPKLLPKKDDGCTLI